MNQRESTGTVAYEFGNLFIGGVWRAGTAGSVYKDLDPYTGETLVEVPQASVEDVDEAFKSAARAQQAWAHTSPSERSALLHRAAAILDARHEEIVSWLIRESGSVRLKAEAEWTAVRAIIMEAATLPTHVWGRIIPGDISGKEHRIYRKPVGVVTVISPWNWPMHLSSRVLAPALALGNAVVLKPAAETVVSGGLLLAKIFEEAGLPPGVLSVITGSNQLIGDPLVLHPLSKVISFTGSSPVGRRIASLAVTGPTLKKVQLELGGNNPLIVLDDAELERAVDIAVFGRFLHQGELCVSANRLIVHQAIYDRFVDAFVERVRALKFGNPNLPDTAVGPIINQRQLSRLLQMIVQARSDGSIMRVGGPAEGLVLPPHVFLNVSLSDSLGRDEIFGPIAPIIKVRDEDEAVAVANDTEYGLSSAIVTQELARAERLAQRIEAGMTHINDAPAVDLANMPFGGEKNSGLGRFGAMGLIEEFTTEHWVSVQRGHRDYPF
ncbi:aldehyde dehydrogenase family protein [Rhodanobacter sp. 7MK24]|uniref:aldehyde dehydrogenase family protein n=1 Tax=Rhodanobacter sp. 7MK24 TaxID=2775922 RepID=UPI00177FFCC5|nr:aldehyde dehydrogenase family protein [Rhodanobacter sp. 7MK24]MBD8880855.1 aldehyde dehydrogenase family protein [Rhodanobacter sp. 7MK24]